MYCTWKNTIKIQKIPTEQYPCSKNVGIRLRMQKLNACKYELHKSNFFYGAQTIFMIFLWLLLHQVNIIKKNAIFKQIGMRWVHFLLVYTALEIVEW